jgi:hypothetical protein
LVSGDALVPIPDSVMAKGVTGASLPRSIPGA